MAGSTRRSSAATPRRGASRTAATGSATGAATTSGGRRRIIDYPRRGYRGLHRWLPSWRFVVGSMLSFVFLCLGLAVAAYVLIDVPSPSESPEDSASTIYFADGTTEIGTYQGPNRTLVDYATLPAHVGEAVVSSEDRTFFENQGISITGMARALWNNIRGGATQGGSTLTQQYVERYYVGKTTTGYVGKAKEALIAIKIAQSETKEQILGRYLNTIYFGRGAYGIEAAAQAYFGPDRHAADLTVSEAALLSGIIPSPSNWDPAVSPEKAEQRWSGVLDGMVRDGYLTQADRDAQTFPATIEHVRTDQKGGSNGYLMEFVTKELVATGTITEEDLQRQGLKIVTTIEPAVQDVAVTQTNAMLDGQPLLDGKIDHANGEKPSPNLKVGIVSVDPSNGAIVSMYGGRDFLADQINRASRGTAQAGSTFKPFTLIAALENGIPLTKTFSGSSPQTFDDWKVNNFGSESFGTIDLVDATANSVNTVYAQLNLEVGPAKTADAASRAGVTSPVSSVPSNVLGTDFVTALDMASAYATIAAQGVYHKPYMVAQATYPDGDVAYSGETQPVQQFDAGVMADTTYAMTQVVTRGSAKPYISQIGRDIAGKTGTSNDNKSAWFVGFTPQIATAVSLSQTGDNGKDVVEITPWGTTAAGRSVSRSGVTGATWPSALWSAYMTPVLQLEKYATPVPFPPRANVNGAVRPTQAPTTEAPPVETEAPAEPTTAQVPTISAGMLVGDAQAALVNAGLVPAVTQVFDASAAGTVLGSDPGSGAEVPLGSTVTLRVSKGPEPAATPQPPVESPPPANAGAGAGSAGGTKG